MINRKYKVEHVEDTAYKLIFSFTTNYEDANYHGISREVSEVLFQGSVSDCEAYMRLHKEGII